MEIHICPAFGKIITAPWAIVGSIGVIAQLPNFHRLLKNSNYFEMHTAGAFRELLQLWEKYRRVEKFKSDLKICI